jgi:hypothetical protein
MEVRGQPHKLAILPLEKSPQYALNRRLIFLITKPNVNQIPEDTRCGKQISNSHTV